MDGACRSQPPAEPPMSACYIPYPLLLERFHPARFEWDGLAVLGNIFRFIDCPRQGQAFAHSLIVSISRLSSFISNSISLARLLAFFEYLLLFHIAFNEQILDIRNPGLLFRAQTMIAFHFDVLLVAPPGDLESLVGNTGKAAEFRCHECYKGIITKGLLPF